MIKSAFKIDFKDLKIGASHAETIIGHKEGEDNGLVKDLIGEVLIESAKICNVKAEFIICPEAVFNYADKSLTLNGINFQLNKIVFGQLKNSDSIAVFLCTAGKEIGERSKSAMQEGEYLRAYIYDIIGSEIVEAASDYMQQELEKVVISSGKKMTNRYNPGYCNWSVAEQHKLFQLLPGNFCGIKLTESALMDPVKSASGFVGIGEKVKYNDYTCSLCDMTSCAYRKVREQELK